MAQLSQEQIQLANELEIEMMQDLYTKYKNFKLKNRNLLKK